MQPQIRLLGGHELRCLDGSTVALPTRKTWALLGYLVTSGGREIPRDEVATLIWPTSGEAQARASLRQELAVLRKALVRAGLPPFEASKEFVRFEIDAECVDALWLQRCIARDTLAALREAAALFRGEYLAGIAIRSDGFEHWLWLERQRLKNMVLSGLLRLLREDEAAGQTARAIATASAVLGVEPTQEQAHRALMRLYRRSHRRAEALRQYRYCCDVLRRDLDTEPSRATRDLAEDIRAETGSAAAQAAPPRETTPARPERRLLSIVAAELCLPTGTGNDAEQRAALQTALAERAGKLLRTYGGVLVSALGGRLVAVFGHPRTSEFDAARAAELAMSLVRDPVVLPNGTRAWARSGVASGSVVVTAGDGGLARGDIAGKPLDAARSIAAAAAPGAAAVTPETAQMLRRRYLLRGSGPGHRLCGRRRRPEAGPWGTLIGRQSERAELAAIWARAQAGGLHAAALSGEAGCGKSHLLATFREAHEDAFRVSLAGEPLCRLRPLFPVLRLVEPLLGLPRARDPASRAAAVLDWGAAHHLDLTALEPLLAGPEAPQLPQSAVPAVHEALSHAMRSCLGARPFLLTVDDADWLDASTAAFLGSLADAFADVPGLILISHRPDGRPGWLARLGAVPLALGPLGDRDAEALAAALLPSDAAPGEAARIAFRARGVPGCIAALARTGSPGQAWPTEVPMTLQPRVLAAFDGLGPGRETLQAGAVVGARFAGPLLAAVTGLTAAEVEDHLKLAEAAGLVEKIGQGPRAGYEFRRPVFHEIVLASLLSDRRADIARQIALARAATLTPDGDRVASATTAGQGKNSTQTALRTERAR